MDYVLRSLGYEFNQSKYSPPLGYSGLRVIISSQPTKRLFDVKALHIPTFDDRFFHQTKVTRHEFSPVETFKVCLGEMRLESYQGESLRVFSFGGSLRTSIEMDDLICELNSNAPFFEIKDEPGSVDRLIADEVIEMIALDEPKLGINQDELYARLARFSPYQVFLACLVSLQNRVDSTPTSMHRDRYYRFAHKLHKAFNTIKETDGWDGHSPDLDELLSNHLEKE
jgi:hypothetical protein